MLEWWNSNPIYGRLILTGIYALCLVGIRAVALRRIRQHVKVDELRRRWIVQVRNSFFFVFLLGGLMLWGQELRGMAVGVVAVAAAIVIATKELIMCLAGSLLKAGKIDVGDRIEITHVRGDVIDQTLLTTTVLEIGPGDLTQQHTGRAITIPNSLFLSNAVTNESFTEDFVLHVFRVPVPPGTDWQTLEREILAAARAECDDYFEEAKAHLEKHASDLGIYRLSPDPRVSLRFLEEGQLELVVRIPAPVRRKGRIEQKILRRIAGALYPTGDAAPSAPPPSAES